jgi:hypothetical protein
MRSIVFDTGPIISFATNNLLWLLQPMKEQFGGDFCITPIVKHELVDKPLKTKKFKFEALQVLQIIREGTLSLVSGRKNRKDAEHLLNIANQIFFARGQPIKIVHIAEIEGLVAAKALDSSAFIIDERTTRVLMEDHEYLAKLLKHKLHTSVTVKNKNLKLFLHHFRHIRLLRSFELAVMAYELKLLDKYLPKMSRSKKTLLEGLLWGVKLNGCAVSQREINQVVKFETK